MSTRDEKPEYLRAAVESVCDQTYPHWEFLIRDDGSRYLENYEWLKNKTEEDSRIRVYRGKGIGLAAGLNELLKKSAGEYFARMDSDDKAYPERIMKEIEYLLRHPDTVLVGSWIRIIDNDGNTIHLSCKPDYLNPPWSRAAHSTWCGRIDALRKIGGYSSQFPVSQDYDCWLRLQQYGRMGMVEEILLDYRWGRVSSEKPHEQIKYFWIANQFQSQRAAGDEPDINKVNEKLQKYSFWYRRKFKSWAINQLGMRAWQQGDYRQALKKYIQSLWMFPFSLQTWMYSFLTVVFHRYPSDLIISLRLRLLLERIVFVYRRHTERAICLYANGHVAQKAKLAIIIPTMDREDSLRRLLTSILPQNTCVDQVVVIDAGAHAVENLKQEFPQLPIDYVRAQRPYLTHQRNVGVTQVRDDIDLVCFFDDDIVVEEGALKTMLDSWRQNGREMGGIAFNIINVPKGKASVMKKMFLTSSSQAGRILRSGYTSMLSPVEEDIFTDWVFGGATVWRKDIFTEFKFDEWFTGYGYGEDLDFSYSVSKKYKLAVVSGAKVKHIKEVSEGMDNFTFGRMQIVNRHYFVRKNKEFSEILFLWASFGQLLENAYMGFFRNKKIYLPRLGGNIAGLVKVIFNGGRHDKENN